MIQIKLTLVSSLGLIPIKHMGIIYDFTSCHMRLIDFSYGLIKPHVPIAHTCVTFGTREYLVKSYPALLLTLNDKSIILLSFVIRSNVLLLIYSFGKSL